MLNTKRLDVKDIYLREPPPDYEVRSLVMSFVSPQIWNVVSLFPGHPRRSSTWAAEGRPEDILAKIDWKETGQEKAVNNESNWKCQE